VGFAVVISAPAERDLAQIVEYIAHDNREAAVRFGRALVARLRPLKDSPRMGRMVPEFRIETLRELILPPYRIVYEVNDALKRIEVARFWHAARGIPDLVE
jgi:toxin ParE1/3/4